MCHCFNLLVVRLAIDTLSEISIALARMIGLVVSRVITSCNDEVLSQSTVIIDETSGKIVSILSGVATADDSLKIITLPEDCTLLPGFIDCHVHLTIPTDDYQMDHLRKSSAEKALRALKA